MRLPLIISLIVLLSSVICPSITARLTQEANMPRIGDSMDCNILMQQTVKADSQGYNVDLSNAKIIGTHNIAYIDPPHSDTASYMMMQIDNRILTSLQKSSYGLSVEAVIKPGIVLHYRGSMPEFITTQDTASTYTCTGRRGPLEQIGISGIWRIKTFEATIITPECDTLNSILCVEMLTDGAQTSDIGNNNRYRNVLRRWYCDGFRYPVLEMSEYNVCSGDSVADYECIWTYLSILEQSEQIKGDSINENKNKGLRNRLNQNKGVRHKTDEIDREFFEQNVVSEEDAIEPLKAELVWNNHNGIATVVIITSKETCGKMALFDSSGKRYDERTFDICGQETVSFDLSNFMEGIYFINIMSNDGDNCSFKLRRK